MKKDIKQRFVIVSLKPYDHYFKSEKILKNNAFVVWNQKVLTGKQNDNKRLFYTGFISFDKPVSLSQRNLVTDIWLLDAEIKKFDTKRLLKQ